MSGTAGSLGGSDPRPTNPGRPFVTSTIPPNNEMGVPLYTWIVVTFNEEMNGSNMAIRIQPEITLTTIWLSGNRTLVLTHEADFAPCVTYWVYVDGDDVQGEGLLIGGESPGAPNPWTFTTACPVFSITRTEPPDGQTGLPVNPNYMSIAVWFSRAADPASLEVTLSPPTVLESGWSNGNAKVTLRQVEWLPDCTAHLVTVSARDLNGNPLANVSSSPPNPWTFTTVCLPTMILRTSPLNGAAGVPLDAPITVRFSKPMEASTVTWAFDPPVSFSFTPEWTDGGRNLALTHAGAFWKSTMYTVTIAGEDAGGGSLEAGPVPNPWSFNTTERLSAPAGLHVARSPPDIALTWRAVPGAFSYAVYSSPDKFAPWPWPRLGEVVGTSYTHPGADGDGVPHYYVVRARDFVGEESGNSTMGVKYPIAFTYDSRKANVYWISLAYRSPYRFAKDISDELTSGRVHVVAKWNPATQSPVLWYFFRGAWRGTNFPIAPGDGLYVGVNASFSWVVVGTDRTVGRQYEWNPPPSANVHWVSLPYASVYAKASDLVWDIERGIGPTANARIVEVGKWDPVGHATVVYRWTPAGWSGQDFPIAPSEGVYIRIVSNFVWTPQLLTPEVP